MAHSSVIHMNDSDDDDDHGPPRSQRDGLLQGRKPTLAEKLKAHYHGGVAARSRTRTAGAARAMFAVQAVTQIYVTVFFLIPYVFQDFDPFLQYCVKVWACYMCISCVANWLCVICYSNVYTPTKDRPDINLNVFNNGLLPDHFVGRLSDSPHPAHASTNGHVTVDVTEKGGLPWRFCKRCNFSCPPRSHHCKYCDRCILRRDHHCFLVGCCIGHWNQRYFVVLAWHAMVVGYVGAYLTVTYLRGHYDARSDSLWNYLLPVTVVQLVRGHISGLQALLTYHATLLCFFGPVANVYFLSQMSIIAQGKTLYEVYKKRNIKVTSSIEDNVRLVFGEYMLVNFLFPAQLIFKQENNGLHFDGVKIGPSRDRADPGGKKAVD